MRLNLKSMARNSASERVGVIGTLDYDPDPDLDGARFPPLVWPSQADIDAAKARWAELGLKKPERG